LFDYLSNAKTNELGKREKGFGKKKGKIPDLNCIKLCAKVLAPYLCKGENQRKGIEQKKKAGKGAGEQAK
jgi:hypothetical protein